MPDPETSSPPTLPEFKVEEMGKQDRTWRLQIRPSDLALYEKDDPNPFIILRDQLQRDVTLVEGMQALMISKPRKIAFRLPPGAMAALVVWVGEDVLAGAYLRRRYSWVLPVAAIWILGSLPLPANEEAGVEGVPLDAVGLGLGVALVVAWAFAKWRPHPVLFLVDSLWFMFLTGYLVHGVLNGRSKLWMILVGVLLWMTITGIKHFARFRRTRLRPMTR